MSSLVELQYNPYVPRLKVLINGKQPSDFSQLIQYSNEDIWQWCNEILDVIYSEIRDDFVVSFIGYKNDADLLAFTAKKCPHCLGVKQQKYMVNEPLQKRLGKMNQLIKNSGITSYKKTVVKASFAVSDSMTAYLDDIKDIDINNLFCSVLVSLKNTVPVNSNENDCYFIITDDPKNAAQQIEGYPNNPNPYFVICVGANKELLDVSRKALFLQTTSDSMITTIFECFLKIPLLKAFRECVKSIPASSAIFHQTQVVSAVEPIVNIEFELPIEVGKSNKINVSLDPPIGQPPKLEYKVQNGTIASCDGIHIYGQSAGETKLEIYRMGEKMPFDVKKVQVIKRNRITKLMLSENDLTVGLNDKKLIKCDYAPTDADNVREITWRSSDSKVIKVDNTGRIIAVGLGECRIICTAENVSAQCVCKVKPYLKEITIETPLEEDTLQLMPMQELNLKIKTIPNDSIDGKIVVKSSDCGIVNVVGQKLLAKNKGEATITVSNATNRITKVFKVIVGKPKKGFFQKLFGK